MKIKEICKKTGLTEKAVRYYVENGLCSPVEFESRDRKYLDFTEENLSELKDVAVMRRLGLSRDDIRRMKTDGGAVAGVMKGYTEALAEELALKNRIYAALSSKDYSGVRSLGELTPILADALRPEPDAPDFSKFDREPFDDGEPDELGLRLDRIAKIEEIFVTAACVIGTLAALTTFPGIIMFVAAALILRKARADYTALYEVVSGIGFLANMTAFVRGLVKMGGISRISDIYSGIAPNFAAAQCRFYLLIAVGELAALLLLIFGRNIREHF